MKLTLEAQEDIREQEINSEKLAKKIREELDGNIDHKNVEIIRKPSYSIEFHRYKLKEDSFNHRIYFDYLDNELYVFAVRHRDFAYTEEDIKESIERLYSLRNA